MPGTQTPLLLVGTHPHWQLRCVSGTLGTHSGGPTHCNQHVPLKGVLQLPLNEHL